ncbi:zinc-binding dehydrogenase [Herbiconiux sp. KACC 21604]|uniref:zinc-binding dehydrogenase n=1 Tax=unclassified Herbiconiux TaxID=2618217 RepID=UPI001490932B|nr:zinc-binding dehydrogenase [Herbiconiux sp. SALV-R1]QJU54153.1 zinc-binding dehydrogenase [Herbiconiux sp. SALV-R1]WPO85206.1 zinc-binding dehydrogenase [Herbiconiux sp. KACC 21604]
MSTRAGLTARAAVLTEFESPFHVGQIELREPAAGQLVVRTTEAPFCSTDWMGWRGMRRKTPPVVLGHTAVGVVEHTGPGVDDLAPGTRVLVAGTPQCGACFYCGIGRPDQCSVLLDGSDPVVADLTVRGETHEVRAAGRVGAYAERMLVERIQVHPLPDDLPDSLACLLGCGVSTALGAVFTIAEVQPGQSVAVLGLGHLGLWAVQGARLAGASRIIAIDGHPSRRSIAASLGATDLIDAHRGDPVAAVQALTSGRGADVVIEAAGPAIASRQAVLMARRAGTVVLTGVAHSATEVELPQLQLTVHGKRVVGCQNGQITPSVDLPRWMAMLASGELDATPFVTRRYGLDEIDTVVRRSLALDDITGVLVP